MAKSDFDPYYRWLGIAPEEQPANHYRLLGIRLFESEPDVISEAADRQMGHLRTHQMGEHAALSQQLLNEIAAAKICLLNPTRKAAYDATLTSPAVPNAPFDVRPGLRLPERLATPSEDVLPLPAADLPVVKPIQYLQPAAETARPENRQLPLRPVPVVRVTPLPAQDALSSPSTDDLRFPAYSMPTQRRRRRKTDLLTISIFAGAALLIVACVLTLSWNRGNSDGQLVVAVSQQQPTPDEVQPVDPRESSPDSVSGSAEIASLVPAALSRPRPEIISANVDEPATIQPNSSIRHAERGDANSDGPKSTDRVVRSQPGSPNPTIPSKPEARPEPKPSQPKPIAHWDFTTGLEDQVGTAHVSLHGGATRNQFGLNFDGRSGYAQSEPLHQSVGAKTLEVQLTLANVNQHGGAPVSIQSNQNFDAIVFGELSPGEWMAGSEEFHRTKRLEARRELVAGEPLHIVFSYLNDGLIRVYRNGEPYGRPYASSGPMVFADKHSRVLFGMRMPPPFSVDVLAGSVQQVSLYACALSEAEVRVRAGRALNLDLKLLKEPESELGKVVYLSDLPPLETQIISGASLSEPQPVGGVQSAHSLFAHPAHNSSSHVAFKLDKKFHTLSGVAAIGEMVKRSATPLTFRVVGDGEPLWQATIQEAGAKHSLRVRVDRVSKLELFVDCPGSADQAHAMWVDLELTPVRVASSTKAPVRASWRNRDSGYVQFRAAKGDVWEELSSKDGRVINRWTEVHRTEEFIELRQNNNRSHLARISATDIVWSEKRSAGGPVWAAGPKGVWEQQPTGAVVFLDDIQEVSSGVGYGTLGKKGDSGMLDLKGVIYKGESASHAIAMHPPNRGSAEVSFSLGAKYQTFEAVAVINEAFKKQVPNAASPLTYRIQGDGRLLWQSRPIQVKGESQECHVAIRGVDILKLSVECPELHGNAHAVWISPRVTTVPISELPTAPNVTHQQTDLVFNLKARDAEIHGTTAFYEENKDSIGGWQDQRDWMSWVIEARKSGRFEVSITMACLTGHSGSRYSVIVGKQTLNGTTKDTGDWTSMVTEKLGTVRLLAGKPTSVELRAITKPGNAVMNVRAIVLKPLP